MSRPGDRYKTPPPSFPPASMQKQDSVISFISTTTNDDDEPLPDKPWNDECDEILWTMYLCHTNRRVCHIANIIDPSAPPPPPSKLHGIYPGMALQRRICKSAAKVYFTVNKKQWEHTIEYSVRRLRKLIDDKQEEEGFHVKKEVKNERHRKLEREDSDDWSRSRLNYRRSSSPYPHQRRQRSMTPRARLFSGDVASTISDISSPVLFGQQEVLSAPPLLLSKQEKLNTPPPILFDKQEMACTPPPSLLRDPFRLQLDEIRLPPTPRRSARLKKRTHNCVYSTPESVSPKKPEGQEDQDGHMFNRSVTPTPTSAPTLMILTPAPTPTTTPSKESKESKELEEGKLASPQSLESLSAPKERKLRIKKTEKIQGMKWRTAKKLRYKKRYW